MTTPAPPLTESCSYCHGARLVGWSGAGPILCPECSRGSDAFTVITQAWREQRTKVRALESELAQLRSGLYGDSLTDAQVAELQRDIELDVGAWDAVGLRQALLCELRRMRGAMPGLIRRSNELPGLSAAHDEAQHELAQLREAIETHFGGWFDAGDGYESVLATVAKDLAQLRQVAAEIAEARRVDGERIGAAETELLLARSELEQLRREKAEREELERRLVAWLRDDSVDECRSMEWESLPDGVETVSLSWETPDEDLAARTGHPSASVSAFVQADGPTYEAALAAVLATVEAK